MEEEFERAKRDTRRRLPNNNKLVLPPRYSRSSLSPFLRIIRLFVVSPPPPPYSEKVLETARISKILSNRDTNREESCVVDAPTIYRAIPSKYTRSTGLTRIELIGGARFERNTSGNTSEEDGYIKVS